MKPPAFEYAAPRTLDEVLALLAGHGDDAKVLAGGQSLVPALNFRLTRPALVVDLNRVDGLDYLDDGRIGPLVRTRRIEREARDPLLRRAASHVGHPQIRNRGTVCGSVAHADPAAELPCALLALGARVHIRSSRGERELSIGEFVLGAFWTALEPDELVVAIEVPEQPATTRCAFVEHTRVRGDFAVAGAAVVARADALIVCLLGVDARPVRVELPAQAASEPRHAGALAVRDLPAGYRRALAEVLVARAVEQVA